MTGILKSIKIFLIGLALGITQVIPGVSGATIAIILGVYFEIIEAINNFNKNVKKHLKLIFPLLIGIACGIILFSTIVNFLLENYSFPTMFFIIGLIIGIIPHFFLKIIDGIGNSKTSILQLLFLAAIPFIALLLVSGLKAESITDPIKVINNIDFLFMVFIFFAGILAAASLIIPGFSGSFVLLLLGIYPLVIYSLSSIRFLLTDFSNTVLLLNIIKVLLPLGIGIIIGGLSMARLIEKLLKNHKKTIYSIILGLLLGSIILLFREPMVYKSGLSIPIIIAGIISLFLGSLLAYKLGRKQL